MKKHLVLISMVILILVSYLFLTQTNTQVNEAKNETSPCKGNAECLQVVVTSIVDGDTLDVNGNRIRLALVNAPELSTVHGKTAKQFVESFCPVGSPALVDQDDLQKVDAFGRVLGLVKCRYVNLNQALLESNLAVIETKFCPESEFRNEDWALKFGC